MRRGLPRPRLRGQPGYRLRAGTFRQLLIIVTVGWSTLQGWRVILPWPVVFFGIFGAAIVGALAGLYPAWRASQMDPAEAVRPAG